MGYRYTCNEILHTLKSMNFAEVEDQGFMPLYRRERITDALHDACGFRTDYQFITKSRMKIIQKKVRERNKILYLKAENKTAVIPMDTGLQRFLYLTNCQRWGHI